MDMHSCLLPTVERRDVLSATTEKCEISTASVCVSSTASGCVSSTASECVSSTTIGCVSTASACMSVFFPNLAAPTVSTCKCLPAVETSSECNLPSFDPVCIETASSCMCALCRLYLETFTDNATPSTDVTELSSLVANLNSENRREPVTIAQVSQPVLHDDLCRSIDSLMKASKPDVRVPVVDMSLIQQPNKSRNLVVDTPNLRSRMNALDFALSNGPIVRPDRCVDSLYDDYYNVCLSAADATTGYYFNANFENLSAITTSIYIYRNTLRVGHIDPSSSFKANIRTISSGSHDYFTSEKPDYSSPYKTDCYYIDTLPSSKLYSRYLKPESSTYFCNITADKLQLPVTVSFCDTTLPCCSLRQFTLTDIPDFSTLFIRRNDDHSLYLSLSREAPLPSICRPLAQLDGPPTNVITSCEAEPADKFPVSFKRRNVHRHIVSLCHGLQKPFWKFVLNLDELIVMKYACVMADVLHIYHDFSEPELAVQLFSFSNLSPRQIISRTIITDCLWGRIDTANLVHNLPLLPLAQVFPFDFTMTHKTDLADVGKLLIDRIDFLGQRLCDVHKLFDSTNVSDFKTSLRVFLVSLVSNIYIITHDTSMGVRIAACVNIINTLPSGSDSKITANLMAGLTSIFSFFKTNQGPVFIDSTYTPNSSSCRPVVQGDMSFPSEGILTSLVQVIIGFLRSSNDKLVKVEDFRVKRLINLLKLSNFTCNASTFASTLYTKTMDIVNVYLFGVTNTDAFYASLHGDLPNWLRGCLRFELSVSDENKVDHPMIELTKYENKLALIRHVAEGERILKILVASDVMSKYARVIVYLNGKLANLRKLVVTIGATLVGMQGKHSPFVVYVHGKPGLGKSMMTDFFLTGLYACSDEKYDPCIDKFSKSATTPYWNGYDSQKVYLIDDFLQTKCEQANNEALADLIALGSRAPFPLNKADVDSKGTSYFNSDCVMITAQQEFGEKYFERFVLSGPAIARRLDVVIEVVGKPDMIDATGKIDVTKVGDGFNPNACLYNVKSDRINKQNLSFADCVIECAVLRCSKRAIECKLDECKIENVDWNAEFVKRRATVQMMTGSDFSIDSTNFVLPPVPTLTDALTACSAFSNAFGLPEPNVGKYNSCDDLLTLNSDLTEADKNVVPTTSFKVDTFLNLHDNFLTDSVKYSVISESDELSAPLLHDPASDLDESDMMREIDEAEIARGIVDDVEPVLFSRYAKNKWIRIKNVMNDAIKRERNILKLDVDYRNVQTLFKSKLIVGFLSTQAVIFSIFALYKIFNHFRRSSDVAPKANIQKTLNTAVRARKNEQELNKIEAREFREDDIAWLYSRAMTLAEEQGIDLKSIIVPEDIPAVKKSLSDKLNVELTKRMDENVESAEIVCDPTVVNPLLYAEVARGIRHAKYQDGDPSKPRLQKRVIRQALEMTAYDDLKLKISSFDDARNRELIAQLTSDDFIEDHCECCERYYLYQRDCTNPLECPYADCESNRERENLPGRLFMHGVNRATILAEILDKSRFGLPMCESARDPQLMTILELTRNNLVRVKNLSTGCTLCGLIVDADIVCFPLHLFVCDKNYSDMYLEINSLIMQKYVIKLADTQFVVDNTRDLMFVQLTKYPKRRSLVKFFHRDDDRINYYDSGYIAKISENNCLTLLSINTIEVSGKFEYFFSDNPTDSRRCVIDNHANYCADTMVGDCGAPVFYVNRAFSRKILGIHVAGSTGTGMSNIITEEYLENMLDKFKRFTKAQVDLEGFYDSSRSIRDGDVVTLLGKVECGLGKPGNSETCYVKSLIHDQVMRHTTKPCMLKPSGDIDPLRIGISKAFKPDVAFPSWMLEAATADVVASVRTLQSEYSRVGLLTDQQNINGDFTLHRLEGINLHSSAGYPWNLWALDGKKRFFLGGEHQLTMGPLLSKTVRKREEDLKQGLIPPFIVTDTLKDERRPIAKVDSGKTRVFSAGPLDLTILVRKYYGSFVAHLMDNCVLGECSVGLNVHGDDWGMMYEHLKSVGDHWIAGDYAAFDKRLPYQIMMAVGDVANAWYNDDPVNQRVREGLMEAMACSMHLADHTVYEVHHGMPSGVPITAVGNSIANSIMFRIAFLDIANELFGEVKANQLFSDFNSFVRLVAYGDDHILRVSDSVKWFNMISISKFFAKYGMEYTTTSKFAAVEEFVSDTDLQYLCRKFVKRDGRIWAPLEMSTIYEMLNWTKKSMMGDHMALQSNVDMALIEMSHYPRVEWQSFYNKVFTALSKAHITVPRLTYQLCLHLVAGYVFDPAYIMGIENSINCNRPLVESSTSDQIFLRRVQREIIKFHRNQVEEEKQPLPNQLKRITLSDAPVTIVKQKPRFKPDVTGRVLAQVGGVVSNDIDRANEDDPTTTVGLTNFSDQAGEVVISNDQVLGKMQGLTVYGTQTLQQLIERPYLVRQIEWTATQTNFVDSLEFPTELFNVKSLAEKLANFRYFRADLEISIRVNASKFHYGKMMAVWKPHALNGMVDWSTKVLGPWDDLIPSSSFQHIFISPTSNEVQTLQIPYGIAPLYVDLADWSKKVHTANVRYNFGLLEFLVLSPLRCSGKVPSVDISVFAKFVNVQLEGYVSEPLSVVSYFPTGYPHIQTVPVIDGYANSYGGFVAKRDPLKRPIAQVGNPESNRKADGTSISSMLTGGAALIGSITTAATLVSKLAGVVLDKPYSTETTKNVIFRYGDLALGRGINNAMLLAIDPDNRVGNITNWMGSGDDHMNIATYASRYGLLHWNTIKVTDVAASVYFCVPVTPTFIPYRTATSTTKLLYHNPLSYMASMFTWWRGSMKYKLQVVASAFHACRLRICWHPVIPSNATTSVLLENESNVISHVLDITTDTELEFTIPYLNDDPALKCGYGGVSSNGFISLTLINTLTHSIDPVPDIDFFLWVAGGEDMEFFRPSCHLLSNIGRGKIPPVERPLAQVNQAIDSAQTDVPLAPAQINVLSNMLCGERIVSISDLLKRQNYFIKGTILDSGANARQVSPLYLSEPNLYEYASFFSYLFGGYRFWRGSFSSTVVKTSNSTYFAKNATCYFDGANLVKPTSIPYTTIPLMMGEGVVYSPPNTLAPCEVAIPYYSNNLFQPTNFRALSIFSDGIPVIMFAGLQKYDTDIFTISAGDDFTLGGIIGTPMIEVLNTMWA